MERRHEERTQVLMHARPGRLTYSVEQAAAMLGLTERTLRRAIERTGMVTDQVRAIQIDMGDGRVRYLVPGPAFERALYLLATEQQAINDHDAA